MIDPVYTASLIVGGSSHKYAFTALTTELLADQSIDLSITITKADSLPFDLSGATAEFFCTARNVTGLVPTNLGAATLSDSGSGTIDTVSIVVPKDGIPDFLGDYTATRTGSSVFYFQIQDADSYIQIYQYVNVTASDFSGDGAGSIELPASSLSYTPNDGADWPDPDPFTVDSGLDVLADRVQTIEDSPSAGDMTKAVYDPQGINQDSFDRNFMTGSQTASTISDFESTVNASSGVSGTVTIHSDISDAGAGVIPSSTTNADIVSSTAHVPNSNNPHNVTPLQVGNTTAQWNANQIQGIDAPIPVGVADDQKAIIYDDTTGDFILATMPGQGGGEVNDLSLDAGATGETIRVSKVGTDIIIKGILGANSADVSTVGSDIVIDVIDSAENVRGAIPIASSADMVTGTDNTKAVTPSLVTNVLSNYQPVAPEVKTTTGVYTLISGDAGKLVKIDNNLTLPVLTTGYNLMIYNTSASTVNLLTSGVTIDNTIDSQIKAKGSISVFYLDSTTAIVDGNTEV